MKIVLILVAAAATLAVIQPAAATTAKGQLFHNGKVVGTVVPPDHIAAGSGLDPLYMVTNGASGQLGIAGVGPGDGPFHGGAWAVYLVTFTNGVTPYLLTSDEAVTAALQAGDVTVVRAPDLDNRCPVYLRRDGYETLEAADGDSARELIEKGEPSLVVLDVMLPGTDGLTLCRTSAGSARSSRTTRRIPP